MKIEQTDVCLELWDANKLEELWTHFSSLSQPDLAFSVAWLTTMSRDDGEVRLSQWIVWVETKSNNQ